MRAEVPISVGWPMTGEGTSRVIFSVRLVAPKPGDGGSAMAKEDLSAKVPPRAGRWGKPLICQPN
ncbi:MAG: hypothetical protein ABSA83_01995 [Verrucomicrobiota bacterium]